MELPGVEPVTPPDDPLLLEPVLPEPPDDPDAPIELVPPLLPEVLPLPLEPAVLPLPEVPDGLVLDVPLAPDPEVPAPCLLQALRESAATTANVPAATLVRDVFMSTPCRNWKNWNAQAERAACEALTGL